ncbi:MAG: outer membrane beta-barrel protein [Acidobacteriota bacterium]|nr:outer membrane beta-barrel protein [Acidobacteriota bacterium]
MRLRARFMQLRTAFLLNASASALLFFSVAARAQVQDAPKFEVGAEFSSLSVRSPDFAGTQDVVGAGARATYNVNDNLAVEAVGYVYRRLKFSDAAVGGNAAQMQFGMKVGRRFQHFGVFAKARPGFVLFSEVPVLVGTQTINFEGQQFVVPVFESRRKTYFSADVGGVLEFYPSRRIVTRFDFGDTMIRYGAHRASTFDSATPFVVSASTRHNFQFTAGVGFRF